MGLTGLIPTQARALYRMVLDVSSELHRLWSCKGRPRGHDGPGEREHTGSESNQRGWGLNAKTQQSICPTLVHPDPGSMPAGR